MECRVTRDCLGRLNPGGKSGYRREGQIVLWDGPLDQLPRWYEPVSGPRPERDESLPSPPEGRQTVPFVRPKDAKAEKPKAETLASLDSGVEVQAGLDLLDPDNDEHWTQLGKVRLTALEDIMGREVGRAEVDAASLGFDRDAARAARR